ncbi:hypothetical protein PanWU01x14_346910 [Parasponia andersonii]|uniref:Uncharacterized protein n=1 Tax=Parasponia andersonii TaxID=3476 RepID=A0A2P5AC65_PARAD|nr:hypothetical protein PanWU01x14_346910 [Parasponia andersonii]
MENILADLKLIHDYQLCRLRPQPKKNWDSVGTLSPQFRESSVDAACRKLTATWASIVGLLGVGSYTRFSGPPSMGHHTFNSSSSSGVNSQAALSLGGAHGGYGGGIGGLFSGPGGGASGASSLYRIPPSSGGRPSGAYPESGHYGLSSWSSYQGPHH